MFTLVSPLVRYSNAAQLEARVKATKFEPGWTLTGQALKKALKQYTKESRKGEDTAKVRGKKSMDYSLVFFNQLINGLFKRLIN